MATATRDEHRAKSQTSDAAPTAPSGGLPRWLPPVAFAVVTVLLFREFIFSRDMLFGTDTLALGYFARAFYAEAVAGLGTFPLWDPFLFGGMPFVDAMHGDIFYPTSLLLFFMETHRALGWKLVIHVFLAGCFAYLWLRGLGAGRGSALFGGLVYLLGSHLVSLVYPGHDGKLFVATLTPLLFWLAERAVSRRGLAEFAWFALGIAALLFTAHMQLAYFAVWGISLYFLFRLAQVWRAERQTGAAARLFGLFALAGVLGAGAAAVQLVPPLLYLQNDSHRAEKTVEAEGESGYAYSTSWSMHPEEAVSLVVPEFVGSSVQTDDAPDDTYWGRNLFRLNHIYAGFIPLLLLGLLFLRRPRARETFFLVLATLALLYALGDTTPAFRVFYALVPGVELFRAPDSIMFLFGLSVATLGAFGLERFLGWAREGGEAEHTLARRYLWGATAVLAVFALLASSGVLIDVWRSAVYPDITAQKLAALEANMPNIRQGFGITFLLAALTAGAWEIAARSIAGRRVGLFAVALLAVVDLWRVDQSFIRTADPDRFFGATQSIRFLQNEQAKGQVFRMWDLGAFVTSNQPAIHGIEQLAGHHGNELGRYRELVGGTQLANVAASELRLLDLLNVRYVTTRQPIQAPGFREVYRGPASLVYRNTNALPRAFLVGRVEVVPDEEAVERLLSREFDFGSTATLPEPLPDGIELGADPEGGVEWIERGLNEHVLRVTTDRPALLVVGDNYDDAWAADVDGDTAPVLRADYTLRAVPVPEGTHTVRFAYRSGVVRASTLASIVLLTSLLGTGLAPLARRLRAAGESKPPGEEGARE